MNLTATNQNKNVTDESEYLYDVIRYLLIFKCRLRLTTSFLNSSKEGRRSSMRNSKDAESSKTRKILQCPIEKILPKINSFSNMSFNSKNSFSSISAKIGNCSSTLKMSAMYTSSSARPFVPPNLVFFNFIIMRSARKD